jgi:hypothetical protein
MSILDLLDDDEDDFNFSYGGGSTRYQTRAQQRRRRDDEAHAKKRMRQAEEKLEARVKVKGIPVKNLEKHVDYIKLKEEQVRRALLEKAANTIKQDEPESRGLSLTDEEMSQPSPEELLSKAREEIVVYDLSDTDKKLLARILQASLKMTDVFFDVSREDREVLLEKLGGTNGA